MRVLVVSGIWPPDVGGPASHAPDVAGFLHGRSHDVEVVTTASVPPVAREYPVHAISRRLPKGAVHLRTAAEIARRGRRADVIYTTGMFGRSWAGATGQPGRQECGSCAAVTRETECVKGGCSATSASRRSLIGT